MTTIQSKNELEFLAQSHETKRKMFDAMCDSILSNYNRLSNLNVKRSDKSKGNSLLALFDKLDHMAFDLYSPQSLKGFLIRIATKPVKVISKPEYKEQPKIYGKGHFRWDFQAYELNENQLQAIKIYLGLHITKNETKKEATKQYKQKPDFKKITGHNEQAEAFLNWAGTTFTTEFKEHAIYFDGDKERRDIYYITIKNEAHRYKFTFGQSIASMGKIPTPYEVLSCLEKNPVYDFADFCSNYGYEEDSRQAYKMYKAVKKESENVLKLFTEKELELLQEIQ